MSLDPRVRRPTTLIAVCAGLVGYACSRSASTPASPQVSPSPVVAGAPAESLPPSPDLPRMKAVTGPLALQIVYPPADAVLQIRDSSFLFGTAGSGDARVTIDGQPARV